jgi:hypothetical protein
MMNSRWNRAGVILCAVIGLAINLGVAYHCLLNHSPPFRTWPHFSAPWYWDRYVEQSSGYGPATFTSKKGAIGCDFLTIVAPRNDGSNGPTPHIRITRAGFPLRCAEGMHSWGGVKPAFAWAIPIQPRALNVAWVSIVPCRPLLLGLIVNTAFYGFLVWMIAFGPAWLLRQGEANRRRRAQCCPNCGYDLRGAFEKGCPECGWGRDVNSAT